MAAIAQHDGDRAIQIFDRMAHRRKSGMNIGRRGAVVRATVNHLAEFGCDGYRPLRD